MLYPCVCLRHVFVKSSHKQILITLLVTSQASVERAGEPRSRPALYYDRWVYVELSRCDCFVISSHAMRSHVPVAYFIQGRRVMMRI